MNLVFKISLVLALLFFVVPSLCNGTAPDTGAANPAPAQSKVELPKCSAHPTVGAGEACSMWSDGTVGVQLSIPRPDVPDMVSYRLYDQKTGGFLGQMKAEYLPKIGETLILVLSGETGSMSIGLTPDGSGKYRLSGFQVSADFLPVRNVACVRNAPTAIFASSSAFLGKTQAGRSVVLKIDQGTAGIVVWAPGVADEIAASTPLPNTGAEVELSAVVDGTKYAVRISGCGNAYGIYRTNPLPPTPNPERKDPSQDLQGSRLSFPG